MTRANRREYFLQLVNTRTKKPIDDDVGSFQVYEPGSPARQTIFDAADTKLTQATAVATAKGDKFLSRTMTNGQIHFFTNLSASSVDLSVLTEGGRAYFLRGLSPSQHRVDVDPEKLEYMLVVAVDEKGSSTTVRASGFQGRKGMAVKNVYVNVTTAWSAGNTRSVDAGVSSDPDGYLDELKCSTAGFKQAVPLSTTGLITAAQNIGALLMKRATGVATNDGWIFPIRHVLTTGVASNNIVFRRGAVATATWTGLAGKGYLYILYDLFPRVADTKV